MWDSVGLTHSHDLQCAQQHVAPAPDFVDRQVNRPPPDTRSIFRHKTAVILGDAAKPQAQPPLHRLAIHILERIAVQHQVVHVAADPVDPGTRGQRS